MKRIARYLLLGAVLSACAANGAHPPSAAPPARDRPLSARALFERGMALARAGDAVRAEQYLLLAMRKGYPRERVIVPLVRVCIASARLRSALAHAEPYLRRHPDAWQLRYLTAAIYLALDRPAAAARELRRVLELRPDSAHAHYLLGLTLRDGLHDPAAARASFDAYLRHAPSGPHAGELRAYLAEREAPRAERAFETTRSP